MSDPQKDAPLKPSRLSVRLLFLHLTFFLLPLLLSTFSSLLFSFPVLGVDIVSGSIQTLENRRAAFSSDSVHILQREALKDTRMKHKRGRKPTLSDG